MKLVLLLVLSCLALHNGEGAPTAARYMFVRCNPKSDQANCVTQQTPEMAWSPDLPAQLPASSAKHLEAELVEDEHPDREEEKEEEELQTISDEGESPMSSYEDGSGILEGSADLYAYAADQVIVPAEGDTGSGGTGVDYNGKSVYRRSLVDEAKPEEDELKQDHLLL